MHYCLITKAKGRMCVSYSKLRYKLGKEKNKRWEERITAELWFVYGVSILEVNIECL